MNPPPLKALFAIACGTLFGLIHFAEWLPIFHVRNAPIVSGSVVDRRPIQQFGVPRVDFSIRLESGAMVHARVQRYLMNKAPHQVRFRYSGDPTREVFLFEHEENPLWIFLCCWGCSLFLLWYVRGCWRSVRDKSPCPDRRDRANDVSRNE